MPIDPSGIPDGILIIGLDPQTYQGLMGFAGCLSALVIWLLWSQGV
jgi:hypothetical protein